MLTQLWKKSVRELRYKMHTKERVFRQYDMERRYGQDIGEMMAEEIAELRNRVEELEKQLGIANWATTPEQMGK